MEKAVLCTFRDTDCIEVVKFQPLRWLWLSLLMLLSAHATSRAGDPKNVNCGRRGEHSGEWHARPRFRSFPEHLLLVQKHHRDTAWSGLYIFIEKLTPNNCPRYYRTVMMARSFFRFLYSTTMIKMLAPHCKPCWVTSKAWKAQRAGTEGATCKRFVNSKVQGLGLGFKVKDKE